MEKPLPVHEGNEPYIFVSYSRDDAHIVFPEVRWLQQHGVNVWYDVGIRPGSEWSDALADAIAGCSGFFYFITPQSVASENCRRELNFALEEGRQVLSVHLTDTNVPRGIRLSLNNRQAIVRSQFEQPAFRELLLAFARQHAGVQPEGVSTDVSPAPRRGPRSPMYATAIGAGLAIAAVAGALWFWRHTVDERWATRDMLPAIHRSIASDDFGPAFTLAQAVEKRLGADYLPPDVWEQIAAVVSIDSAPAGAKVSYRQYAEPDEPWVELGQTPVHAVRLPRTMVMLKAEKTGYATAYRASDSPGDYLRPAALGGKAAISRYPSGDPSTQAIELVAANTLPAEMVHISASQSESGGATVEIPAFLIDRFETTNRDYQAFVDAGGYGDPAYWRDLAFVAGDRTLDWQSAVARFVDATGYAGPAGWELGKYPEGDADLPVTGVSWYEAAAYARYRGKSLPTVHHWTQAASGGNQSFAASLISQSNFGGRLREIGSTTAMGPYGTYDLLGNAREWAANAAGSERIVVGGATSDAPYSAFGAFPASPWDRSSMTGIRCAIYLEPVSAALRADVPVGEELPPVPPAMPDEMLDGLISAGSFASFDSKGAVLDERQLSGSRMRRVSLSTGLADERLDVYVLIPDDAAPPYETLIYMSGSYAFEPKAKLDDQIKWEMEAVFSPILRTGRVVIWPTWYGSFDRYDGLSERSPNELPAAWGERVGRWRRDTAAVLDYLASSAEFSDKIGWVGLSFGAIVGVGIVGNFVPPFKCAILVSGGDLIDQPWKVTYYRRMNVPVLMLNGRYDKIIPIEQSQRFFELYGARAEDKRQVIYEAEHWPLPRNQVAHEMSTWLDRYLGPVGAPVRTARLPADG